MKTRLPLQITTVEEAKIFLTELHANDERFHPEDNAHGIEWELPIEDVPTYHEAERLNILMAAIYNLPGNDGRHEAPMVFDPCAFLSELDEAQDKDTTIISKATLEKTFKDAGIDASEILDSIQYADTIGSLIECFEFARDELNQAIAVAEKFNIETKLIN